MSTPRRTLIAVVLALFLLAVGLLLVFGGSLTQEPAGTLLEAVRLSFSSTTVAPLDADHDSWIVQRSGFDDFIEILETHGWRHVEQLGAGHLLERQDADDRKTTTMVCRMYSRAFQVCDL